MDPSKTQSVQGSEGAPVENTPVENHTSVENKPHLEETAHDKFKMELPNLVRDSLKPDLQKFAGHKLLPDRNTFKQEASQLADRLKQKMEHVLKRPEIKLDPTKWARLLKEPVLKQKNLEGSAIKKFVEGRATGEKRQVPAQKKTIAQLASFRHQVGDKKTLSDVIKHEISSWRRTQQKQGEASQKLHLADQTGGKTGHEHLGRHLKQLKGGDGESAFEKILKKAVAGETAMAKQANAKAPKMLPKTEGEWKEFFINVEKQGSAGEETAQKSGRFSEGLFRGLFKSGEKGTTVVTDLKMPEEGNARAEKFARLLVKNPDLLPLLEKMQPGEILTLETLLQVAADKEGNIEFTKLVNLTEKMSPEALKTAGDNSLSQARSNSNAVVQAKFEKTLLEGRAKWDNERLKLPKVFVKTPWDTNDPNVGFWPFAIFKRKKDEERKPGPPRLWTFLIYTLGPLLLILLAIGYFRGIF